MRRLAAAGLLVLALTSCAPTGSPKAELQTRMNAITEAANAKDAAALRTAVDAFLKEVAAQSQNADITSTRAQELRTVAEQVLRDAALLVDAPSPEPSIEDSPSPEPSPTPKRSKSPKPEPSPEPSPTEASPSPDPSPIVGISTSPSFLGRWR